MSSVYLQKLATVPDVINVMRSLFQILGNTEMAHLFRLSVISGTATCEK